MSFRILCTVAAMLAAAGCALTARGPALRVSSVDSSLSDIRAVVNNIMPAGVHKTSVNGRELVSRRFMISNGQFKPVSDALHRYFVKILILGDRRPYDVEILVSREERVLKGNRFTYAVTGYDRRLAQELERKLTQELTKRREDRNIIDDFRVF